MSIIFVSEFFPSANAPAQTGGTISNRNFLRALAKWNSVTVLSFDRYYPAEDYIGEPFKVTNRPAPEWHGAKLMFRWLHFVRSEAGAALKQHPEPQALIATTSSLAAFDVAPSGTRRIAIVQAYENFGLNCVWVPFALRLQLAKQAVARRFQDARLMRSADAVLTNSHFLKSAIAERFRIASEAIYVVPQMCDLAESNTQAPHGTVGFVHRGAEKGISFVLELARRSPELKYLIYGRAKYLPIELPKNVEFLGWAPDRSLMFASAAVWLVPSLWAEPFGRVSVEAQAANRAVLVANSGGLPETVFNPRFRIDGFDIDKWLARVRELTEFNPGELSENGARVRAAFSEEHHDTAIAEVMAEILSVCPKYVENVASISFILRKLCQGTL